MVRHVIVVPCFNEERRLDVDTFLVYAASHPEIRLLFVDDGSTDGTRGILEGLRSSSAGAIDVLGLDANVGKAEAVRRGIRHAAAERPASFGFWDADLSTPLEPIEAFVEILETRPEIHVVMGSRVKLLGRDIERRALRHYLGRVFATCASAVLNLPVYDTQCGAKLFRNTRGIRWAFAAPFLSRWLFDVEVLARIGLLGKRRAVYDTHACVYELPLHRWRDVAGSKIRLRDWLKAVWELARIRCRYR